MLQLRAPAFIFAAVAGSVFALGPHAKLPIVNRHIAPDGFPRLWVFRHCCQISRLIKRYLSQCHPRRGLVPWSINLRKKSEIRYKGRFLSPYFRLTFHSGRRVLDRRD